LLVNSGRRLVKLPTNIYCGDELRMPNSD